MTIKHYAKGTSEPHRVEQAFEGTVGANLVRMLASDRPIMQMQGASQLASILTCLFLELPPDRQEHLVKILGWKEIKDAETPKG